MEFRGHGPFANLNGGAGEPAEASTSGQEQFAGLFEDCRADLRKVCERILRNPDGASDAVSETYLRAYRGWGRFDGRNLAGWLSRIARRVCLDHLRSLSRDRDFDLRNKPLCADGETHAVTVLQIRSILAKLPEPQRQCLKLFYIEGFKAREVAQKTGFTEKQVKSHLQNGRRNFVRAWKAVEKGDA